MKDVPWTLWKAIFSAQESDKKVRQITWVMHGFQNTDKVSCYANTVLQCILHSSVIRKKLLNVDKLDILSTLVHRYENGMLNLNTYSVRQYLGDYFSTCIKRDTFEFLIVICTQYDYIRNLVEHQFTVTSRCKSCGNTKVIIESNIVVSISVKDLKKKSNLNELLKETFSTHWCPLYDKSCEYCAGNNILFKNELTLAKEVVIIRFILFSL